MGPHIWTDTCAGKGTRTYEEDTHARNAPHTWNERSCKHLHHVDVCRWGRMCRLGCYSPQARVCVCLPSRPSTRSHMHRRTLARLDSLSVRLWVLLGLLNLFPFSTQFSIPNSTRILDDFKLKSRLKRGAANKRFLLQINKYNFN